MTQFSNIYIFCFLLLSQCYSSGSRSDYYKFPESYSIESMEKIILSDNLEEVSGLEWIEEGKLWAIEDESSVIFEVENKRGKITNRQKFAKNKDIEDILELDGEAWVLQSNGNLYHVKNPLTEYFSTEIYEFPLKEKRDFEAIIKVENEPVLWIFCKVCSWDKGPDQASVFAFNLDSKKFENEPVKVLRSSDLETILNAEEKDEIKIQPSAIALHPIANTYYMLSSSDKWLMTLDLELNPIELYHLNPSVFKQPEGITFDEEGNLYISNEAQDGRPNMLIFQYRP